MEFASEMLVRASLANYRIQEVPATLKPDGRSRPPHLRTWRDGWRHLRFLLIHTPRWLFFYPGLIFLAIGVLGILLLGAGRIVLGGVGLDIHTFLASCMSLILGLQLITFAMVASKYAVSTGFIPVSQRLESLLDALHLEKLLLAAGAIVLLGLGGAFYCVLQWERAGFGDLRYAAFAHILMLSLTAAVVGVQLAFSALLSAVISDRTSR